MAIFSINVYPTRLSRIHNCEFRANNRASQLATAAM